MSGVLLPRAVEASRGSSVQSIARTSGVPLLTRRGRRPSRAPLAADVLASLSATVVAVAVSPLWVLGITLAWVPAMAVIRRRERGSFGVGRCDVAGATRQGLMLVGLTALICVALGTTVSMIPLVVALTLSVAVRALDRVIPVRVAVRGARPVRVLVVGHAADVAGFARRSRDANVEILGGCVGDPDSAIEAVAAEVLLLGDVAAAGPAALEHGADAVIVLPGADIPASVVRELAWGLRDKHVQVAFAPALDGVAPGRLFVDSIDDRPLVSVIPPGPSPILCAVKSLTDRMAAALLLLLLFPLIAAVAVAVKMDSRGPVLFRQQRVGRAGAQFTMLKFRSMCIDAEAKLTALQTDNINPDGPLFKIRRDPRVTRVGRILRRLSIDELPQLVNVLRGDMSLVGPRPPLPSEVATYDETVSRRLAVKPGLTGLWQVSGRSELAWDESVRLDLDYVENWSVGLDASILRRTARAVFGGAGAY